MAVTSETDDYNFLYLKLMMGGNIIWKKKSRLALISLYKIYFFYMEWSMTKKNMTKKKNM